MQTKQTIFFSPTVLAAALQFSADRDVRYYLNGVCLEFSPAGTVHAATNGHILFAHNVGTADMQTATGAAIIGADDCKRLLRDLKKCKLELVPLELEFTAPADRNCDRTAQPVPTAGRWHCALAGCGGDLIEGRFPDWRRVVPRSPMSGQIAQFNSEYLNRIRKAFELLGDRAGGHFAVLHNGNSAALCLSASHPAAAVVIMPMRYDSTEANREHAWIDASVPAPIAEEQIAA